MMDAVVTKEHEWLRQLVGEWTYEMDCPGGPDGATMKVSGKETVRAFGDIWFQAEGLTAGPDGAPARTLLTVGYDPQKGRFCGTWIGTMMNTLWVYDGELDERENKLVLGSRGPNTEGGTSNYRDIIIMHSRDERSFVAMIEKEDGRWETMMAVRYSRKRDEG